MRPAFRSVVPLVLTAVALAGGAAARERPQRDEPTPAERAGLDRALKGLVPGRASTCLNPSVARSASSHIYGPTIIYTVSSGLKYRTDTGVRCGRRGGPDTDVLVTNTPIGQNCAGDPVRVVDRTTGALSGVCNFGPFVPYRRP